MTWLLYSNISQLISLEERKTVPPVLTIWQYMHNGMKYVSGVVYEQRWKLLGTAGAWFILDVVFYANSLFSGQVTTAMGISSDPKGESVAALILNVRETFSYRCIHTCAYKHAIHTHYTFNRYQSINISVYYTN